MASWLKEDQKSQSVGMGNGALWNSVLFILAG